jgi:hypothetical protein
VLGYVTKLGVVGGGGGGGGGVVVVDIVDDVAAVGIAAVGLVVAVTRAR